MAERILGTGLFDFDTAHAHPLWAQELYSPENHGPQTEEYGISSFVYRARAPFHPEKLKAVLEGDLPVVILVSGHFWIETRPDWAWEFSLAGAVAAVRPLGGCWAAVPREVPSSEAEHRCAPWGDRRQELVFIGRGFDRAGITARLDAALPHAAAMTPEAMTPEAGADLPDPFPVFAPRGHLRALADFPRFPPGPS